VVEAIARRDRDLSSQVRRAMSSVGLNLAEGFGTAAGNARLRFETARGSLCEAHAGIGIAIAWGFVSADVAAPALAAIDALGARVYGLSLR
jgi:four helix bundle protein